MRENKGKYINIKNKNFFKYILLDQYIFDVYSAFGLFLGLHFKKLFLENYLHFCQIKL